MSHFLRFISYLTHPIFVPVAGTALFFAISPKYTPSELIKAVLISLTILSVVIPFILFYLLRNMGLVKTYFLASVAERKIPVLANIILLLLIMYRVVPRTFIPELFFFMAGAVGTMVLCYIMLLLKIKASMHMMGLLGLTIFTFGMSYHFKVNLIWLLAALVLLCGATATSRLYFKAHTKHELLLGSLAGAIPQFFAFHYWL